MYNTSTIYTLIKKLGDRAIIGFTAVYCFGLCNDYRVYGPVKVYFRGFWSDFGETWFV